MSEQASAAPVRPTEFPPLEQVRQNLRVKWYRSPIDPATLRRLMQRSDLRGALQAVGYLRLIAATGAFTAYFFTQAMWLPFAVTLWCHGTVGTLAFIANHELGHGTVFRTRWLNGFIQSIFSLLSFRNPDAHGLSHIYHHRYTLYPDVDRELPGLYSDPGVVVHPKLLNIRLWLVIQKLTFDFASLRHLTISTLRLATRRYRTKFTGIFASEWARALFASSPDIERKAVRLARLTIALHVAGLTVAGGLMAADRTHRLGVRRPVVIRFGRDAAALRVDGQCPRFPHDRTLHQAQPVHLVPVLAHELACRAPHVRRRALLQPQEAGQGDRPRHAAPAHAVAGVGGDGPERQTPAA